MGLFGLFKKKETEKKPASRIEPLDRLTKDGKLPFGWYTANREFTERIDNEHRYFLDKWIESKKCSPKEQYAALKSLVTHTEDVRRECKKKGECFVYWSEALYGDKDFYELQNELESLKKNMKKLEKEYKMTQEIKQQIPKIIKKNPGVLQTEIYKMFPEECKGIVSTILYLLSNEGKIIRKKAGNTYSLKIKR